MAPIFYTVTIDFEDRTVAIEQVAAVGPEQALELAFEKAEAFQKYPRAAIELMRRSYLQLHLADLRGIWIWHQVPNESQITEDIFGGLIVQTDPAAPLRSEVAESSGRLGCG